MQGRRWRRRRKSLNHKIPTSTPSATTLENDQASAEVEGGLRLSRELAKKRDKHSYRVHIVPVHFCCDRGATL